MANTFKNAFAEDVNHSATAEILAVPSGNSSKAVVIGCQLSNKGSSEIKGSVVMIDNSASTSNEITLVNEVAIPANSMVSVLQGDKVILEESDKLKAKSDTASALNIFISYLLVDST
jgi:hypothetical protein